nr:MAG: hypothetical protein H3BulkLitter17775_000004 [Leviviridae sp.]
MTGLFGPGTYPITRERPIADYDSQLKSGTLMTWMEDKFDGSRVNSTRAVRRFSSPQPTQRGRQMTVSENHAWNHRARRPDGGGDVGGPFFTEKKMIKVVNPTPRHLRGKVQSQQGFFYWDVADYIGPVLAMDPGSAVFPASAASSKHDLDVFGTKAIAIVKPTNSVADVANFLAEFASEGLPKLAGSALWEQTTLRARDAGEEYLNLEFGWKPMVSDIRSIVSGISHAHSVLGQYERGSKSIVRRRYDFPEFRSSSLTNMGATDFAITSNSSVLRDPSKPPGVLWRKTDTYRKVWFSGAFRYHLPTGFHSRNALEKLRAKADSLLGISITPEVLWNAAPWSWAVDWFSNAGDLISNYSDWATDGLVLEYGYVMETSSITDTYFMEGGKFFSPVLFGASPIIASVETKQRTVATPYGFGLSWDSFSPRQWAIVTALGLTKKR